MHRHKSSTKPERRARQLASEEALREKATDRKLAEIAQQNAVETACKVFEEVLAKEARAVKAESYRLALVAKNQIVACYVIERPWTDDCSTTPAQIPFAALPRNAQRAAVVALMVRRGEA